MNIVEQKMYDYLLSINVPSDVAERAAQECGSRITRNASIAFGTGVAISLITQNPGALIVGAGVGSLVGFGTLVVSPSCSEVREAAFRLASPQY
jgi:phosphotransferase system  glucose/maltose/N-acetylglucosamine-specific IIC component